MSHFAINESGRWPLGRFPGLAAVPQVVHGVTTRNGPEFGQVGTDEATATACRAAAEELGLAGPAWAHQMHGGVVRRVRTPGMVGEADALVTDTPGLLLLGRSADCPIILVAGVRDDGSPAVGFAHASWRATVAGITSRMLTRLVEELQVNPATIRAAIAPSAGPCCYEVGDEVVDEAVGALGRGAAAFFMARGERWHFDLWAANRRALEQAGVPTAQIESSGVCTICHGERFWSWRAQGVQAGRFAGVIGILG